jgi:hypothetical protein
MRGHEATAARPRRLRPKNPRKLMPKKRKAKVRISINLDPDIRQKADRAASEQGFSLSVYLEQLVRADLIRAEST